MRVGTARARHSSNDAMRVLLVGLIALASVGCSASHPSGSIVGVVHVGGSPDVDKPIPVTVSVVRQGSSEPAASVPTDRNGHFQVDVRPGHYDVVVPSGPVISEALSTTVDVEQGRTSSVDLSLIRARSHSSGAGS